ncbi:MAG: HesA/MoeB/ThiF family protein [Ferruginibacter sp.]
MPKFNIDELVRYSRQMLLPEVGIEGQEKLKNARVLVIGAGGLGCPALQYLSAAGVGTLGIVDFDKIEIHNLHRQILYNSADVGKQKAIVAAEKINQSNPNIHCIIFNEKLQQDNAANIISQFDIVVDGSDNFATRYLVNDTCVAVNKPLVYGTILKFDGQLAVFNYKGSKNLRDIYPDAPNPEDVPNCDENGVLGIVPGIIGAMMCDHALKIILGRELLINTLFIFDMENYTLKKISY